MSSSKEKGPGTFRPATAAKEERGFRPLDVGSPSDGGAFRPFTAESGFAAGPCAREREEARLAKAEAEARGKGYKDGRAHAARMFQGALAEIETYKARVLLECKEEILDVAMAVARRVLRRELAESRETVTAVLWEAIRAVTEGETAVVRVSASDLKAAEEAIPGLHAEFAQLKDVIVRADPAVSPGGCIVETAHGSVDARVEAQLDAVEAAVKEAA